MTIFTITYDLRKPGRNYTDLYEAIKRQGIRWYHPVESVWLVESSKTAVQIRDDLTSHMDQNDKLLVIQAGPQWATYGLDADWLKRYVTV